MKYNTIDQYPVGTKVTRRNSGGANGATGVVVETIKEFLKRNHHLNEDAVSSYTKYYEGRVRVKWDPYHPYVSPVRTWVNIKFLEINREQTI